MNARAARWQGESACPSHPKTNNHGDKRLSHVFVGLRGKNHVTSEGGNKYSRGPDIARVRDRRVKYRYIGTTR